MAYNAPLRDMRFVLTELIGLDHVAALPGCEGIEPELVDAVLEEAAKFARDVLAPLNQPGDQQGAQWRDGAVRMPPGFADAYARYVEGGWNALSCDPGYGGQGLPAVVSAAVEEMWHAANMAFGLCPLLTRGAIEALHLCGTPAQKDRYLHKLVEGAWTGTMNLTEPQAGSDLSAVRTRAVPDGGQYRIYGQKIYITYGEHDMAENIVHLVLARLPDAPEGVRGHLAVRGAEDAGRRGRIARRAQRRALRLHRTQARHPRQPDGGAGLWRRDRRHRRAGRRTQPRP